MKKTILLGALALTISARAIRAQGPIQSRDIRVLFGGMHTPSQTIPGTDTRLSDTTGVAAVVGYGYQLARFSSTSLWAEPSETFGFPGKAKASIPGSANRNFTTYSVNARLMAPVKPRVSVYAVIGGGTGEFHYSLLSADPSVISTNTWHGVFEYGAGADFRLSRIWSLRTELRDDVTGRGLSRVSGRHHLIPVAGVALHLY